MATKVGPLNLADLFEPEKKAPRPRRSALSRARNSITFALKEHKSSEVAASLSVDELLQYRLEIQTMGIYALVHIATGARNILSDFGPSSLIVLQEQLARRGKKIRLYKVRRSWKSGNLLSERRVIRALKPP